MGIFSSGNSQSDYTDDAIQAEQDSYNQAASYMQPFTQYASTDFDAARNALIGALSGRQQMPNYNQNFYSILDMSPTQLMNQAVSGYSMSPQAQQEEKYAMSGMENAMTSQGMGGSGDYMMGAGEVGNTIYNQDLSNYLGSLMTSFGVEEDVLGQYDKSNQYLVGLLQDMLGVENKASTDMASNSMKEGQVISSADTRAASDMRNQNPMKELLSLVGAGASGYESYNTDKILTGLLTTMV